MTIYPSNYRNSLKDVIDFYKAYLMGKDWQFVSYWFVPPNLFSYG